MGEELRNFQYIFLKTIKVMYNLSWVARTTAMC